MVPIIGVTLVIPVMVLSMLLIARLNEARVFQQAEVDGSKLETSLLSAYQALQALRSSAAAAAGGAELQSRVHAFAEALTAADAALAGVTSGPVAAAWHDSRSDAAALAASVASVDALQAARLTGHWATLIGAVADESQLSLDPVMETYSLVQAVTSQGPTVLAALADLQAQLAGTNAHAAGLTPAALAAMAVSSDRASHAAQAIIAGLGHVNGTQAATAARLRAPLQALQDAVTAFDGVNAQIGASAGQHFDRAALGGATDTLDQAIKGLLATAQPELQGLLAARLAQTSLQLNITVGVCGLGMLIAALVLLSLRQSLAAAARMNATLSVLRTGVMFSTNDGTIQIANEAASDMFGSIETELRRRVPSFNARKLVGLSYDIFHRDPSHQRNLLQNLMKPHHARVALAGQHFEIVVSPVFSKAQKRLGAVIEWHLRTPEVLLEQRTEQLINAAADGDFSARINMEGLPEDYASRVAGYHRLLDSVHTSLGEIGRVMGALAGGDLTQTIDREFNGQLGTLARGVNKTVHELSGLLRQIRDTASGVRTAAAEISAGNTDLANRTERQAISLQETSQSAEELTAATRRNASGAQQAHARVADAREIALKGGTMAEQVVQMMKQIDQSSRQMAEIIGVIDAIAFQTNILALNAAVEAAHAGQQGRGFAVVATEVRNLAHRCSNAAREIRVLIGNCTERVGEGSALVNQTGDTIREVVESVSEVVQFIGEISTASVSQSADLERVNNAVRLMDESTQQNSALVEESSACARNLRDQSELLMGLIARFHSDEQGLSEILAASSSNSTAYADSELRAGGSGGSRHSEAAPEPAQGLRRVMERSARRSGKSRGEGETVREGEVWETF